MNIVLTETKPSQSGRADITRADSPDDAQFSNLMNQRLQQDEQPADSVEYPQVIENKGVNKDQAGDVVLQDLPPDWLHNLNGQFALEVSEANVESLNEPHIVIDSVDSVEILEQPSPVKITADETGLGEVLPLDGTTWPSPAGIVSLETTQNIPVKEVLPVATSQIKPLSITEDRPVNQDGDDSLAVQLPRSTFSTETAMPAKIDGLNDRLQIAGASEFQLNHSISNSGSDINSSLFRLANQTGLTNLSQSLPPQLETMTLNNPRDQVALGSGLGDRIQWMVNQKLNTATIRMDPPSLGRLEVHIQMADDVTNVTINTQHLQTRDLIDNASVRLREYLQENGHQNVNVDVSQEQQQQASDQSGETDNRSREELTAESSSDGIDGGPDTRYISSDSVVDYFA